METLSLPERSGRREGGRPTSGDDKAECVIEIDGEQTDSDELREDHPVQSGANVD
jgi:hypothetical protein